MSILALLKTIEQIVRWCVEKVARVLPVKIIRDDRGVPFLYRYHLFAWGNNGPGMCIHHFVKSDPERGYHDHPWRHGLSFILCGGYDELIVKGVEDEKATSFHRPRFTFNHIRGEGQYHRVMLKEGADAWTIFAFTNRSKTWGMVGLDHSYKPMSTTIHDQDGGWWALAMKGLGLHQRRPFAKPVIATVDVMVRNGRNEILVVKRGKQPFQGAWALPGGRVDPQDSDLASAAQRELREETNLSLPIDRFTFVTVVGNRQRDPRGFTVSCVYKVTVDEKEEKKVKAGDDAVDWQWLSSDEQALCHFHKKFAFDHADILCLTTAAERGVNAL